MNIPCPQRLASRLALAVLPLAIASCAAEPSLVGFPAREVESEREEAGLILQDVRAIESALEGVDTSGARWLRPFSREEVREAMRAIFEAQLVLSGEHFDYQDPPQEKRPARPPIQLYPRLTCPAYAEPVEIPGAEGQRRLEWFVPLIFDRDSLYWDDSFRTVWLGWPPEKVDYSNPGVHMSMWLIPHGAAEGDDAVTSRLDNYLVRPGSFTVALGPGGSFQLPDVTEKRAAYGMILPVKSEAGADGFAPGNYDVRLLPRIKPEGVSRAELSGLSSAISGGDWFGAAREAASLARSLPGKDEAAFRGEFGKFVDAIDLYPPTWFDPELDGLRGAFQRIEDGEGDLEGDILRLGGAIRSMLRSNPHPAPVCLAAPAPSEEPFCFVVSGDWQYHADMTNVRAFLGLLDPALLPSLAGDDARHALVAAPVQEKLRKAKFVIALGDLGDGQGLSSSPGESIVTSLGLAPPLSPYDLEFVDLSRILSRFRLPVFAVPGNHDGFANYGGFANDFFAVTGKGLKIPGKFRLLSPIFHVTGELFVQIGNSLPVMFKFLRVLQDPFFDGLVQWRYHLGPTQFAFRFRGYSFVGLNSYNIAVKYRDQVGPLANNWGGGVERRDVVWLDVMLRRLRGAEPAAPGKAPKRQFIFFHHDPRGARPFVQTYEEGSFGSYDAAEAPLNALTFGYLGLGWSSNNPLWLPIITPIMSNLPSQLLRGSANFNQEWMKKATVWDSDCYGARPLIEAINGNLAKGAEGPGVSHIFFGHDDVPVVSQWVDSDQAGRVFPTEDGGDWPANMWGWLAPITPFFRTRTVAPPEWGREMYIRDGRNAAVIRCDDVGQSGSGHGFCLVTVDPAKAPPADVTIDWIEIP